MASRETPRVTVPVIDRELTRAFLQSHRVEFHLDYDLAKVSWLKQPGTISFLIKPGSVDALREVIRFLQHTRQPYKVLGNSSNCYFAGERFGIIISLCRLKSITIDEGTGQVCAEAGSQLIQIARKTVAASLAGFEGMAGIPGTLGGAIFMNAGSYDCDIARILTTVTMIHPGGEMETLHPEQLGFDTRTSNFKRGILPGCIVSATFQLPRQPAQAIQRRMAEVVKHRAMMQENREPNLGSMFIATGFYQTILKANPLVACLSLPIRLPLALGNRLWRRLYPLRFSPFDAFLMRFYKLVFRYPRPPGRIPASA